MKPYLHSIVISPLVRCTHTPQSFVLNVFCDATVHLLRNVIIILANIYIMEKETPEFVSLIDLPPCLCMSLTVCGNVHSI